MINPGLHYLPDLTADSVASKITVLAVGGEHTI